MALTLLYWYMSMPATAGLLGCYLPGISAGGRDRCKLGDTSISKWSVAFHMLVGV